MIDATQVWRRRCIATPVLSLIFLIICPSVYAQYYLQPAANSEDLLQQFDQLLPVIEEKLYDSLQEISFDPSVYPAYTDRDTGRWVTSGEVEWTSGFFSGILWQIYELTGKTEWSEYALLWTDSLERMKNYKSDHDTGFRIMPGYGGGFNLSENLAYLQVMRQAANTLAGRYRHSLGVIRSWDWTPDYIEWNYPVIIDNMMNLELLFRVSENTNDTNLFNIARNHAITTLDHHFREDGSIYHIVDFADDGSVRWKGSIQGYSDTSVWARGQSWAIYGFAMAYRFTREPAFLEASESAAAYFIGNLPEDGIPYYDFLDPSIPNTPRDVSAAAVAASALLELYELTGKSDYLKVSEGMLQTMSSLPYFNSTGKHSSLLSKGARQKGMYEVGLIYADYYFLEAWIRYLKINERGFPELVIPHFNYLGQNHPNPFRSFTTIPYVIQSDGQVQIRLYDITGRVIRTFFSSYQTSGSYLLPVTASGLAAGVYFYELATPEERLYKKMLIIP